MRRSQPPHASNVLTSLPAFHSACLHVSLPPRLYHNVLGFSSTSFTPVSSTNLSFPASLIISASFRTLSCTALYNVFLSLHLSPCPRKDSLFQETKFHSSLLPPPSFDIFISHLLYRKAKPAKCPKVSQHSPGPVFLGFNALRKIYDVILDENSDELRNKEAKLAVIIPADEERSNRMQHAADEERNEKLRVF